LQYIVKASKCPKSLESLHCSERYSAEVGKYVITALRGQVTIANVITS